ncbi:YbjN domain-containing protein [Sorangium sp. So ce131]|uniref:YbjN domain-containing protein n=1 Tax=Sorangium sp. So ce131 TaxID=3133282 RepID=UPI003F609320
MVNAYLARYTAGPQGGGASPGEAGTNALDETGYAQLQHGSATIGVNVLEAQGVLMVFSPIMAVPQSGREAFYRRLLELSFITTSDAAFAIDRARNEVVVRCLRRLSALDYEEFEDIVATVSQVADTWDDALLREFRGG